MVHAIDNDANSDSFCTKLLYISLTNKRREDEKNCFGVRYDSCIVV